MLDGLPASILISVTLACLKFLTTIVAVYIPVRNDGTVNTPSSLVVGVNSWPVPLFLTVTDAPGTTAPVGSITVPVNDPVGPCPKTDRPQSARIASRTNTFENKFLIGLLREWYFLPNQRDWLSRQLQLFTVLKCQVRTWRLLVSVETETSFPEKTAAKMQTAGQQA